MSNLTTSLDTPPQQVSIALLALIAFTGTLAMHIFVPALPKAAEALSTDSHTIQLSVTLYILGLALGQILYGPLAEAFGRRPAVLAALIIFLLGSIASFFAPNVETLLLARLVQALGGAGGLALSRVIVADTAHGNAATKGLALLNMILMVGPGLAPIIGAQISDALGWRAIFIVLIALGAAAISLSLAKLPETGHPVGNLQLWRIVSNFRELFANPKFRMTVSGGSLGSTACYAYFVAAPFILHSDMGLSVQAVGYCVGATFAAGVLGTITTRQLIGRVSGQRIALSFAALGGTVGLAFTICALTGWLNPFLVVTFSCLILLAAGGMGPINVSTALSDAGPHAGSASGVYGSVQMGVGVLCSFTVGLFTDQALGCGLILLVAYAISWAQLYRHG